MAELDALGNEILVGAAYGFSRNVSGYSYTTVGIAAYTKNGKVRLVNCVVTSRLYGIDDTVKVYNEASDVSINAFMVFPVALK
jgi:hypothetical protein